MSELPEVVEEAGLLFRQQNILQDREAMRRIIVWGHEQIDVAYPIDPVRAPLNVFRRKRAHMEWDRVIRTAGKELRGFIASTEVQRLQFEIERWQADQLARDAERRRREAVTFDTRVRIEEHELTSQIDLRNQKDLLDHQHHLQQDADDAASRRRMAEQVNETEQDIRKMINQAILDSMGSSSAREVLELVTKVSNEITRIRHDHSLDDDDKHLHIKALLDSLPAMLQRAREHGR